MSADALQSRAFERASLKSESQRVWTLLAVLIALLVFVILRGLATQSYLLLAAQTLTLVLVIAHETVMLRAIKAALRDGETVKPGLWVFNVFVESQLPTLALFLLLLAGWMTPYQVLVAPAIAIYFLFITLSTLRLSPSLTLTTGLLSCAWLPVRHLLCAGALSGLSGARDISLLCLSCLWRSHSDRGRCRRRGCASGSWLRDGDPARSQTARRTGENQSRSRDRPFHSAGSSAHKPAAIGQLRNCRLEPTSRSNRRRL